MANMILPNITSRITESYPVSEQTLAKLFSLLKPIKFNKRDLIVREGTKCGHAYFIETGLTRSYWLVDGVEYTTSFTTEGAIVFSMDELYYGRISEEFVQALEPVEAYAISIPDLKNLIHTHIDFANWWSAIHQDEYRRIHQSHKERLTLPAAQRYEAFQKQFPEVCRRANLGFIASYLGINQSTLSRLRGR